MEALWIKRIVAFAKRHGVRVVQCEKLPYEYGPNDDPDYYVAPFNTKALAIEWRAKVLHFTPAARWDEVIHELGHLLACKRSPNASDEWAFFGWEYQMAHMVSKGRGMAAWRHNNADYGINEPDLNEHCIGGLSDRAYQRLMDKCVATAKRKGLVTAKGIPCAIR